MFWIDIHSLNIQPCWIAAYTNAISKNTMQEGLMQCIFFSINVIQQAFYFKYFSH